MKIKLCFFLEKFPSGLTPFSLKFYQNLLHCSICIRFNLETSLNRNSILLWELPEENVPAVVTQVARLWTLVPSVPDSNPLREFSEDKKIWLNKNLTGGELIWQLNQNGTQELINEGILDGLSHANLYKSYKRVYRHFLFTNCTPGSTAKATVEDQTPNEVLGLHVLVEKVAGFEPMTLRAQLQPQIGSNRD